MSLPKGAFHPWVFHTCSFDRMACRSRVLLVALFALLAQVLSITKEPIEVVDVELDDLSKLYEFESSVPFDKTMYPVTVPSFSAKEFTDRNCKLKRVSGKEGKLGSGSFGAVDLVVMSCDGMNEGYVAMKTMTVVLPREKKDKKAATKKERLVDSDEPPLSNFGFDLDDHSSSGTIHFTKTKQESPQYNLPSGNQYWPGGLFSRGNTTDSDGSQSEPSSRSQSERRADNNAYGDFNDFFGFETSLDSDNNSCSRGRTILGGDKFDCKNESQSKSSQTGDNLIDWGEFKVQDVSQENNATKSLSFSIESSASQSLSQTDTELESSSNGSQTNSSSQSSTDNSEGHMHVPLAIEDLFDQEFFTSKKSERLRLSRFKKDQRSTDYSERKTFIENNWDCLEKYPEESDDATLLLDARRESYIMWKLRDSPRMLRFYGSFLSIKSRKYIILMEYVPGPNLDKFQSERHFLPVWTDWKNASHLGNFIQKLDRALRHAARVSYNLLLDLEALHSADEHGTLVIHQDMKLENVSCDTSDMVPENDPSGALAGEARSYRTIDYGGAAILTPERPLSHSSQGTMSYMSDEHYNGLGHDAGADIYSLAIIAMSLVFNYDHHTIPMRKCKYFEQIFNKMDGIEGTLPNGRPVAEMHHHFYYHGQYGHLTTSLEFGMEFGLNLSSKLSESSDPLNDSGNHLMKGGPRDNLKAGLILDSNLSSNDNLNYTDITAKEPAIKKVSSSLLNDPSPASEVKTTASVSNGQLSPKSPVKNLISTKSKQHNKLSVSVEPSLKEHKYQLWSDFLDFLRAILHPESQPINGLAKSVDVHSLRTVSQMRPSASDLLQMPFILRGKQEDDVVEAALSKPKPAANLPDGLSHRTMSSPIAILQTSPVKRSIKNEGPEIKELVFKHSNSNAICQSSKIPNQNLLQIQMALLSKLNKPPGPSQTPAIKGKALFLNAVRDGLNSTSPHSSSTPNVLSPRSLNDTMGF